MLKRTTANHRDYFPDTVVKLQRMVVESECWALVQQGQRQRESYEKCLYFQTKLMRVARESNHPLPSNADQRAAHFAERAGLHKLAERLNQTARAA